MGATAQRSDSTRTITFTLRATVTAKQTLELTEYTAGVTQICSSRSTTPRVTLYGPSKVVGIGITTNTLLHKTCRMESLSDRLAMCISQVTSVDLRRWGTFRLQARAWKTVSSRDWGSAPYSIRSPTATQWYSDNQSR